MFEVGRKACRCPRRYYNFLRWPKVLIPNTQILQRKIAVFYQKHFKGHFEKQPASAFRICPVVVGQRTHPSGRSENCTILSNIQSKSGIFFLGCMSRSSEETSLSEVAWRLEALRSSSFPQKSTDFRGPRVGSAPHSAPRSQWSIPPLLRSSMCSEWGLLALARRTYSSKCPLDISRCGLIASSTAAKLRWGPQSSEETQRREVAWRLEALRYSSSPPQIDRFAGPPWGKRRGR